MSTSGAAGSDGETRKERIDRELIELLNELRVALPGVQFLFAFLLVVYVIGVVGLVALPG